MGQVISLSDLLVTTQRTPLTMDFFNTRFKELCDSINGLGARLDFYDQTQSTIVSDTLSWVVNNLSPYIATLQQATQLGFLTAQSVGGEVSLVQGAAADFVVTTNATTFVPTKYLLAVDDTDPTNWGLLRLITWTPPTSPGIILMASAGTSTSGDDLFFPSNSVPSSVVAGMVAFNVTTGKMLGTVGSTTVNTVTLAANAENPVYAANEVQFGGVGTLHTEVTLVNTIFLTTNAATLTDSDTMNFDLVPNTVLAGMVVRDITTSEVIGTVDSVTDTTVVLGENAAHAVGEGDSIQIGGGGNFSTSWTLSANAAIFPALASLVEQAKVAEAQATAAYDSITAIVGNLNTLIASIQAGAVASVAGKGGIVQLAIPDITGTIDAPGSLVDALAAKASVAALNSGLAAKQPLGANLTALAGLTLSANKLPYATGAGAMDVSSLTAFARTLLACEDAASVLTALGISTFHSGKIVADDADSTATDIVLTADDNGKVKNIASSDPVTVTCPNNLPKDFNVLIHQSGIAQISFQAASGAALNNRLGNYNTAGMYAVVSLLCTSNVDGTSAVYTLGGDTGP